MRGWSSGRPDPQRFQRLEHALRRGELDDQRLAGLKQALEAREDRGPARASAGEDVVAERPVMGFGQRQPYRLARRFDLVGDEGRTELLDQRRPVDIEGD